MSQTVLPTVEPGPSEVVLRSAVARRSYLDGASKSDIAAQLSISRFRVARLLDAARASGLVRIELDPGRDIDLAASAALRDALGLHHCVVVRAPEDEADARAAVGSACARLMSEVVTSSDVLGLAWSRALVSTRDALRVLARCDVVQLSGALARDDVDESAIELVRDVARLSGGTPSCYYAPMVVADAATAAALREQPDVARALSRHAEVTVAVVGLGAWERGLSTIADAVSDDDLELVRDSGVRAEFAGVLVDADGGVVRTPVGDRLLSVDGATLLAVDELVAVVYGSRKADALVAGVRAGVTSVVTTSAVAERILHRASASAQT